MISSFIAVSVADGEKIRLNSKKYNKKDSKKYVLFGASGIMIKVMVTPLISLDRKTYPHARVIGYGRVSTIDQDPQMQIDALRDAGAMDDNIFIERVSAAAKRRPQLDLAIKDCQPGDVFVVWKLDRLARSVEEALLRIGQIEANGGRFVCLTQTAIDTQTAIGKLLLVLLAGVAEFERNLIRERTKRGMESKSERGLHMGRPPTWTPARIAQLKKLLERPMSIAAAARKMELSESGIHTRLTIKRRHGKVTIAVKPAKKAKKK